MESRSTRASRRLTAILATAVVTVTSTSVGAGTAWATDERSSEEAVAQALSAMSIPTDPGSSFDASSDGTEITSTSGDVTIADGVVTLTAIDLAIELPGDPSLDLSSTGTVTGATSETGLEVAVVPAGENAGVRLLTVADDTYSENSVHRYEYGFNLPVNVELRVLSSGDLVLVDTASAPVEDLDVQAFLAENPGIDAEAFQAELQASAQGQDPTLEAEIAPTETVVGAFERPWSVDADGVALPTSYVVEGGTLVQTVDTAGAAFPVVSDPAPLIVIGLLAAARAFVPLAMRAFAVVALSSRVTSVASAGVRLFPSYSSFLRWAGAARPGYQWHHIVPQTQRFVSIPVSHLNSTRNLIQIPTRIHQACVTARMNSRWTSVAGYAFSGTARVSDQVTRWSWDRQYRFGIALLRSCGVNVS